MVVRNVLAYYDTSTIIATKAYSIGKNQLGIVDLFDRSMKKCHSAPKTPLFTKSKLLLIHSYNCALTLELLG